MAGARTFVVRFLADAEQYKKGIKQVNDGMGGLKTQVSSLMPSFKTMAIAGAAAFAGVAAFATKAVQAAAEDQKSQALLAKQLQTTFGASDQLIASTERLIATQQLLTGESDTNLRAALGSLTRATGDYSKATGLLSLAQDIASQTGADLTAVSLSLGKASLGNFTALKKLGVPIDENVLKSKDFQKVLESLTATFGGASATAADTFSGRLKIIRGQFGEIVETVGAALLPYLDKFAKFLTDNVAPAVSRVTSVIGDKGLIAGFQQLIFESGKAGPAIIGTFKTIAVAVGNAANILYKAAFLSAAVLDPNIVNKVKYTYKAISGSAVDIDKLKASFDSLAMPVNHFKTELMSADAAERFFNKTGKTTADTLDDLPGGVAKAVKTATEKLKIYTDALKGSNSAQKSFKNAQDASIKAGQSLTAANQGVVDAQTAFNQAVAGYGADSPQAKKAAKDLELAQRGLERAGYNVEGSLFAIANAEAELKKVRADPESTPQAIREAEIALAEAKLSSADAIDQQTEATNGLKTATNLLSDAVNGASIGSDIYKTLSDALTTAKERQADASKDVADAIDNETDALTRYAEAIAKVGETKKLYPKVTAANPMAGFANSIPATVTGNSTGFNSNGAGGFTQNVTVTAGIVASPDEVAQELANLSDRYRRLNGSNAAFF